MLTITTGTVYGKVYNVIQVHNSELYGPSNIWNEMITWAVDTFGPTPYDGVWTSDARWYVNNAKFWFKDKKDLEWFLLRWQ